MMIYFRWTFYFLAFVFLNACQDTVSNVRNSLPNSQLINSNFYSLNSNEKTVHFNAVYKTTYMSLTDFSNLTDYEKNDILQQGIPSTLRYLFGPLTYRQIGGPQKDYSLSVDWASAKVSNLGYVHIPYTYTATWVIKDTMPDQFELPLPLSDQTVFTNEWINCTDSAAEHQTPSFFWYFWDPNRTDCDHQLNSEYQTIKIKTDKTKEQQNKSYPEYTHMIRKNANNKNLSLTFAFGYVDDLKNPYPDADSDPGMHEYRKFLSMLRKYKFEESDILQGEYLGAIHKKNRIGSRFSTVKNGVKVIINVVTSADIDQMELYAKSFAHDNDSFFGWFGHSRIGSGFDADKIKKLLSTQSSFYKVSGDYQLLYWGGCNSYSYYSLPFFKLKADMNPATDPNGTQYLDIISHGLPSLFSLNAANATVVFRALINWKNPTSFQNIIDEIESNANAYGITALANVLGDEDND